MRLTSRKPLSHIDLQSFPHTLRHSYVPWFDVTHICLRSVTVGILTPHAPGSSQASRRSGSCLPKPLWWADDRVQLCRQQPTTVAVAGFPAPPPPPHGGSQAPGMGWGGGSHRAPAPAPPGPMGGAHGVAHHSYGGAAHPEGTPTGGRRGEGRHAGRVGACPPPFGVVGRGGWGASLLLLQLREARDAGPEAPRGGGERMGPTRRYMIPSSHVFPCCELWVPPTTLRSERTPPPLRRFSWLTFATRWARWS